MYENFGNFLLIIFTMNISSFTIKKTILGRIRESRVRRRFRESRVKRRRPVAVWKDANPRLALARSWVWQRTSPEADLASDQPRAGSSTSLAQTWDWHQTGLEPGLAPAIPKFPSSHSRFLESSSHSRFPFPAENRFFYRKTGNFHRKNDQEKISEIFVHLAPENTGLNQVSKKSCSKNSF